MNLPCGVFMRLTARCRSDLIKCTDTEICGILLMKCYSSCEKFSSTETEARKNVLSKGYKRSVNGKKASGREQKNHFPNFAFNGSPIQQSKF